MHDRRLRSAGWPGRHQGPCPAEFGLHGRSKGGVHKDIPEGEIWIGYPATPEAEQKRLVFSLKRVPEMRDQVRAMEKQIALLTKQLEELRAEATNPLRQAG